jgi:hypothetical protein
MQFNTNKQMICNNHDLCCHAANVWINKLQHEVVTASKWLPFVCHFSITHEAHQTTFIHNFSTKKETSRSLHPLAVYVTVILNEYLPNVRYYSKQRSSSLALCNAQHNKIILLQVQATASSLSCNAVPRNFFSGGGFYIFS